MLIIVKYCPPNNTNTQLERINMENKQRNPINFHTIYRASERENKEGERERESMQELNANRTDWMLYFIPHTMNVSSWGSAPFSQKWECHFVFGIYKQLESTWEKTSAHADTTKKQVKTYIIFTFNTMIYWNVFLKQCLDFFLCFLFPLLVRHVVVFESCLFALFALSVIQRVFTQIYLPRQIFHIHKSFYATQIEIWSPKH